MAAAETWGAGEVSQAQILQGRTGFNLERGRRGAGEGQGTDLAGLVFLERSGQLLFGEPLF